MDEVSLKEYTEKLMDAADKRHEQRFIAQEQAIALASARAQLLSYAGVIVSIVAIIVSLFHK